ncbi:hypothetical protein C8R47DRAFT_1270339 [Mycena vitilis]|nr:hypothetical protein C8R47DRAFT_1270339 [Mycena vitilis]
MRPVSRFTAALGLDGRVVTFHDQARLQASDDGTYPVATEKPTTSGKLIVAEKIMEGSVRWSSVELYLRGKGGLRPVPFFLAMLASLILQNLAGTLQTWYLGYFSSQYDTGPASEVSVLYHLGIYSQFDSLVPVLLLCLWIPTIYACGFLIYTFGILRASDLLHRQLMESVFGTTIRWLDTTPSLRIITRATQDSTVSLAVTFGAIVLFTPVFFGPGLGLFVLVFMPARISVKREMSNARSPVLGQACGCQDAFMEDSLRRLDCYSRCARLAFDLTRWSVVRTDVLSNVFTTAIAVYLVYFRNYNAANTGFSLTVAFRFGEKITHWILRLNYFQLLANNLERIEAYINIEQEPKPTKYGLPPAAWPSSGELVVKNLSARYSEYGLNVLHGISYNVKSGEHIGIVGRTGSGKSSLTLSLLRAIITKGSVFYDGIETASINLDALRSKITIIPQMLLGGTLRQNLDPFGQFEDQELIHALRAAGLFSLVSYKQTLQQNELVPRLL